MSREVTIALGMRGSGKFRLLALTELEPGDHGRDRQMTLGVLALSSLLAIAWSIYSPRDALWAFLLNAAAAAISRAQGRAPPASKS
jgi:hypothetical protein